MRSALSSPATPAASLAWPLFIALACFYLLGTGGYIDTPDGVMMFRVTRSLVGRHTAAIAELRDSPGWGGSRVFDASTHRERFYAKYGLGLSLAAIPAYILGGWVAPLARESEKDLFVISPERAGHAPPDGGSAVSPGGGPAGYRVLWYDTSPANFDEAFRAFSVSWTNCLIVSGTVVGLFLICLELGFGSRVSVLTSLLGGIATPLWHYSKTFFAEPLGGMGLVYFFYFALRGSRAGAAHRDWLLSGLSLGLSVLAKPVHLVLMLPGLLLVWGYLRPLPRREAWYRASLFSTGSIPVIGVVLLYNQARFGSGLETGYGSEVLRWTTPLAEGLAGLLVSPGRGLLFYFPLLILTLVASRRFAASFRIELLFIWGCLIALLGVYARWYMWEGGWCWGPRFLVPVMPLLVIPVASLLRESPRRAGPRILLAGVVVVACLVSFSGVLVNYNDFHHWLHGYFLANQGSFLGEGVASDKELWRWHWSYAPLLRYWVFPIKDYFFVLHALRKPGLVLSLYFLWALGLVLQTRRLLHRAG